VLILCNSVCNACGLSEKREEKRQKKKSHRIEKNPSIDDKDIIGYVNSIFSTSNYNAREICDGMCFPVSLTRDIMKRFWKNKEWSIDEFKNIRQPVFNDYFRLVTK
jgi:hypothetical protein